MINKRDYRKTNDKKILRKVGKQWKVVSVALLMAIVGGATVAAQANADENTDEHGISKAVQLEDSRLEQLPPVAHATPASGAVKSGGNASSAASVSYLNTDGGSAASYHVRATSDQATQSSATSVMSPYVKSLNAKFPFVTSLLKSQAQSATRTERDNEAAAQSYSTVASASSTQTVIDQLATKAGMSTYEYVNSVQSNLSSNNASMSEAAIDESTMNSFYDIADVLFENNYNWPSIADQNAYYYQITVARNQVAQAQYSAAENKYRLAISNSASNIANRAQMDSYKIRAIEATAQLNQAEYNQSTDASITDSLAESLGYSNSDRTSQAIKSLAKDWYNFDANVYISNSSAVSLPPNEGHPSNVVDFASVAGHLRSADYNWINSNSASIAFYQDVSDAAILNSNPSYIMNADRNVSLYDIAKAGYTADVHADKAELKPYQLDALSTSYAASLASEQANTTRNIASSNSDTSIPFSNRAAVHLFDDMANGYDSARSESLAWQFGYANLAHSLGNHQSGSSVNNMTSYARNILELNDNAAFNKMDINYIDEHGEEILSLGSDISRLYGNGHNGVNLSAAMGMVETSISNNYANTQRISASYAKATDASVTASSYLASSYASDAGSFGREAQSYSNSLTNFYLTYSDQTFAKAHSAYEKAKADDDNAAALAEAYGIHIYDFAPKYVTVIQKCLLHSNPQYTKANAVAGLPVGTALGTLGIGLAENGTVRYQVNVNGKPGYITSNPAYVQQRYLPAQNDVNVKMLKTAKIYGAPDFGQYVGKTIGAGTLLNHVDVISLDGLYGGFTNLRTAKGHYITANTLYAQRVVPKVQRPLIPSIRFWR